MAKAVKQARESNKVPKAAQMGVGKVRAMFEDDKLLVDVEDFVEVVEVAFKVGKQRKYFYIPFKKDDILSFEINFTSAGKKEKRVVFVEEKQSFVPFKHY